MIVVYGSNFHCTTLCHAEHSAAEVVFATLHKSPLKEQGRQFGVNNLETVIAVTPTYARTFQFQATNSRKLDFTWFTTKLSSIYSDSPEFIAFLVSSFCHGGTSVLYSIAGPTFLRAVDDNYSPMAIQIQAILHCRVTNACSAMAVLSGCAQWLCSVKVVMELILPCSAMAAAFE
ncbi:hypothetical protein PS2_008104 [Malus domestica]